MILLMDCNHGHLCCQNVCLCCTESKKVKLKPQLILKKKVIYSSFSLTYFLSNQVLYCLSLLILLSYKLN